MNHFLKYLFISCFLIAFLSCKNEETRKLSDKEIREQKEMMVRVNKYLVEKDVELITSYIERKGWQMEVTESGLFYQIYKNGDGRKAVSGKYATIYYHISLLDGTICYHSDDSGPKKFMIGRSNEESGLEQGVLMMRAGDKARFIMPPHLAHGLLGDDVRIPPRSIIVYEVELLEVSD